MQVCEQVWLSEVYVISLQCLEFLEVHSSQNGVVTISTDWRMSRSAEYRCLAQSDPIHVCVVSLFLQLQILKPASLDVSHCLRHAWVHAFAAVWVKICCHTCVVDESDWWVLRTTHATMSCPVPANFKESPPDPLWVVQ